MEVIRDFAGLERTFAFKTGQFLDLESARKCGIGVLYKRLALSEFAIEDVRHILKQGLIGGGMSAAEADQLVREQMDAHPPMTMFGLAMDVFLAAVAGLPEGDGESEAGDGEPMDQGALFHGLVQAGLSPQQVRDMRFDDFLLMMKAAQKNKGGDVSAPTEAQFEKMKAVWESRQV